MKKEKQIDLYIGTTTSTYDVSSISMATSTMTVSTHTTNSSINYTVDSNSYIFVDGSGTFSYSDPYSEIEEIKQQQEKEEELRKENSCLQNAWDEYQLILKLLEENECDKFVEKRYGIEK